MAGAAFFALANKSRTRDAPTPTNISTNSEPLMWKNGTSASPATALASKVLPVPGEPVRSTPLGIFAPISANRLGFLRKSTISTNSSLASLAPATSANVFLSLVFSGSTWRGLLSPKPIARLFTPCALRLMR
jgi:hypothetical protein